MSGRWNPESLFPSRSPISGAAIWRQRLRNAGLAIVSLAITSVAAILSNWLARFPPEPQTPSSTSTVLGFTVSPESDFSRIRLPKELKGRK